MAYKKDQTTKAWQYYELGREYNERLVPNQYNLVNSNIEFFIGNQWAHLPQTRAMQALPKPTFNIIKRIASLFVASITSSAVTVNFEPLAYYDGTNVADPENDASAFATAEIHNLYEKFKMEYRGREALFDGAQTGDYVAHFWWDPNALPYGGAYGPYRGEIRMEMVDGINVMFGNPNNDDIQEQPYVLLIGRDTVKNLKEETIAFAKSNHKSVSEAKMNAETIQPDSEYMFQAGVGGRTEMTADDENTGKSLYVLMYTKYTHEEEVIDPNTKMPVLEEERDAEGNPVPLKDDDGKPMIDPATGEPATRKKPLKQLVTTVHVTKATRTCTIYEDVDTGLTMYPVAFGHWERQKNQYHGRALVTGIIPNQIFINSMMALAMRHVQLESCPTTIYNADLISEWSNEIGRAVAVYGLQPGQSLADVAYNMAPADMSNQIMAVIDKAMAYTKDCLGATDAQMGNVQPDNTSALMVLQSTSEVPLENTRACYYEWHEDIGAILLDMIGTYYGERPTVREKTFEEPTEDPSGAPVIDPNTGKMQTMQVKRKVVQTFDFSQFKHLFLNVKIDVGATNYFSEIAMQQTLDNLRTDGVLDVIQYLERLPDKAIPRKAELIQEIKVKSGITEAQAANAALTSATDAMSAAGKATQQLSAMNGNGPIKGAINKNPSVGGDLSPDKVVGNLPNSIQAIHGELPNKAKNTLAKLGQ